MHIEILDLIIRVLLVLATGFLFAIILKAYLRVRNSKMFFIAIGFGIFFIHALAYIPEIFIEEYRLAIPANAHLVIHLTALIFIAVGMFKD
ncbi:hypothetical protein GTO27_01080 [Candidatus Bathyarchaeota archaeon]|nr:hypothetical protein [Candidatus Bathyarchaeota archaeon]